MENTIIVAGIGPGSPDYLLPAALRAIEQATVLVGSSRALATFARVDQRCHVITADIQGVLDFVAEASQTGQVVILVSGDPGFYSLLAALRQQFGAHRLEVIPGISSVQLAFARLGEVWHDAILASMHGREAADSQLAYEKGKKLGLLTDNKHTPAVIAKRLLAHGWPQETAVWLCEHLSYQTETILAVTLAKACEIDGFAHAVMVVKG